MNMSIEVKAHSSREDAPMEPTQVSCSCDRSQTLAETAAQPICPVCGGHFVPLGGLWRCTRCSFTTCEGCEGTDSERY
jgi:hypothetical protein